MGCLILYLDLSGCSGLLDPGLWVWGVCCAGILSVDLVSEFVEVEQLLGRSVVFFLSPTLGVILSGFVSASV